MKFPLDFSSFEFLCPDQLLQMTPDFLFDMPETSTTVSSDPGSDMGHSHTATGVGTSLFDVPIDITRMLPLSTPSEKAAVPTADTDPSPRNEDPGDDGEMLDPITTLTGLLSEIRRYEGQLAQISGQPNGTFENYPIGEALFLSKRFCSFLSNCSDRPLLSQSGFSTPTSAPSEQYLPIILLALSCYLSLVHVHQSVFTHMHSHLLRITDSGPRPDSSAAVSTQTMGSTSISTPSDVEADMHAYRGLQLCQLQPVSTEWELARRIKKAVGMLLGLLGNVEKALGIPLDVRIVTTEANTSVSISGRTARMSVDHTYVDARDSDDVAVAFNTVFEKGIASVLTGGRLCRTLREGARRLRDCLDEVDEMLKGLLEI